MEKKLSKKVRRKKAIKILSKKFVKLLLKYGQKAAIIYLENEIEKLRLKNE